MSTSSHELFRRHADNPILTAEDWPYPVNSVFNCGATMVDGVTVLLVRVEDLRGMSHLTVARSTDGLTDWQIDPEPTLQAEPNTHPEELWGIEDPRITFIDDLGEYFITYTAYSRGGPLVALIRTRDFRTFERMGAIMPPDDKDAAFFPVRFNGRWALLHRPSCAATGAHIWLSFSPDLRHWGDHRIVLHARSGGWWDANKIGLSPPPLPLPEGWLVFYHGVRTTGGGVIYRLGVALLDPEDPTRLLRRGDEWVLGPRMPYEREGDVRDVVFPGGWTRVNDEIRLYYGGADSCIAVATTTVDELRDHILHCPEVRNSDRWG